MIEWTFFYKLLGIPERFTEPTHYHLLGLDPKNCSPDAVDIALEERRKRLRQNIPGPQFIPLVMKFEQDQLVTAAEVLRDPRRREAYNAYLHEIIRQRKARLKAEQDRQRIMQVARSAIQVALNPDGTLDESKRPPLAQKLGELGVPPTEIEQALAGIPLPDSGAARPPVDGAAFFGDVVDLTIHEGLLLHGDEQRLLQLAAKLRIPREQAAAVIEQRLAALNACRGVYHLSFLKNWFAQLLHTRFPGRAPTPSERADLIFLATSHGLSERLATELINNHVARFADQERETPEWIAGSDTEPIDLNDPSLDALDAPCDIVTDIGEKLEVRDERIWPRRLLPTATFWNVAIPTAAVVLFSLFFFARRGGDSSVAKPDVPDHPPAPMVESPSPSTPDPIGEAIVAQPATAPAPPSPAIALNPPAITDVVPVADLPSNPVSQPSTPPASPVTKTVAGWPEASLAGRLRRSFASPRAPMEALLGDTALALSACSVRARELCGQTDGSGLELINLLGRPSAPALLADEVSISIRSPTQPAQTTTTSFQIKRLETLKADCHSAVPGIRYRAIEELHILNTPAAVQALLDVLDDRCRRDTSTCSRIIRTLSEMTDPDIPRRLIEILGKANSRVSFLISQALIAQSDVYVPMNLADVRLRLRNTRRERQECVQWWREKLRQGVLRWNYRQAAASAGQSASLSAAWDPNDHLPSRLIAAAIRHARLTAQALESFHWTGSGQPVSGNPAPRTVLSVGPDLEHDLLDALDSVGHELSRLVREHSLGKDFAVRADIIELEKKTRIAASATALQRAVVALQTEGALLELLIEQSGGTGLTRLVDARMEKEKRLASPVNVLDELRESALYNLGLWEMLNDLNSGPVAPSVRQNLDDHEEVTSS